VIVPHCYPVVVVDVGYVGWQPLLSAQSEDLPLRPCRLLNTQRVVQFQPQILEVVNLGRLCAGIRTRSLIALVVCLCSHNSCRICIRVASGSGIGNAGVSVKLNRGRAFLVTESSKNTTIFVLLTWMDILFFSAHC
jgi:hypothetical protein